MAATQMIRLILLDGDPEGLRVATIAGRTTTLTACPWPRLRTLLERDEARRPGVYMLVGTPIENSDLAFEQSVYVGECDALAERFGSTHHKADAAEWTQIFLATTSEGTFNKAHARLAEHRLRQRAVEAKRAAVLTKASSEGKVDEGDAAFANEFVENVVVLAQTLGLSLFRPPLTLRQQPVSQAAVPGSVLQPSVPLSQSPSIAEFVFDYRKGEPIRAKMATDGTEFVVLAGSLSRAEDLPGLPLGVQARRLAARASGILVPDQDGFERFTADYPTTSPSAAGSMVYGSSCAGPVAWRHVGSAMLYKDWLAAQQQAVRQTDDDT